MDNLKFMPVGKVKMSRTQYFKRELELRNRAVKVISTATFVLGFVSGIFIATYI